MTVVLLGAKRHTVKISRESARCCDRHECYVARCSCGWETDRRDTSADLNYAIEAVQAHKVDVLLKHAGVTFTVVTQT